ncbi:MAG: hypothetical protein KDC49_05405 [Saprospiraceae bacterium]|nr:hypothetical protein [Saprospiraceae bacterium]
MGYAIFLLSILVIFSLVFAIFLKDQSDSISKQLQELKLLPEDKINIQYTFSKLGSFTSIAALPMHAEMYIGEQFVFIIPGPKQYLNLLNYSHLPILLTSKNIDLENRRYSVKVIRIQSISKTGAALIKIEFNENGFGRSAYTARIKVLDSNDFRKIESIDDWC